MPFFPDGAQDEGLPYDMELYWEHVVAEYLGTTVTEVLDLDLVDFLALRREAFIASMSKTQDGREYLENCKMFEAEDADYDAVRKLRDELGGMV